MIYIKARIRLYTQPRTIPFGDGYYPMFNFVPETKHGGRIHLLDRDEFFPGDEGLVEVWFPIDEVPSEDFAVGKKFTFHEGSDVPIGEGIIKEILKGNNPPFSRADLDEGAFSRYEKWLKDGD